MSSKLSQKVGSLLRTLNYRQSAVLDFGRSVVLTSAVIATLVVGIRQMGILEAVELGAFDQMMRWRPNEAPDERLLVVAITEKDIQEIQQATLSDQTLNRLLGKLQEYQPLAIGLDIFRDVPIGTGRADLLKRFQHSGNIIAVCKTGSADHPGVPPPPGIPKDRVGFSDQVIDTDGIIRRSLLFISSAASNTPAHSSDANTDSRCDDSSGHLLSLGFQLALRYLQTLLIQPEFTTADELKLGSTVFSPIKENDGGYQKADVGGYQILLNYRSSETVAKQVTLTQVLEGKLDPNWINDRIVLVGYTAPSKKDDFFTPYSAGQQETFKMPGVVVHAQIVSQILSAVLNDRPLFRFWTEWGEMLWIAGWSLVGGTLAWRIRYPVAFGFAGIVAIGGLFGIGFVLFTQAVWIPIAAPIIGLIATAGSVIVVDRFEKGGYANKIYQGVQKLFKIEIDQEEKARQLTEYEGMINRVQQWHQQAQDLGVQESLPALDQGLQPLSDVDDGEAFNQSADSLEIDYFEQLQQKAKALENQEITQQLIIEITEQDVTILERYCQKTERNKNDVLREFIHSLEQTLTNYK
ncbi:MAG: CHASE2 domain-containing protein [Coleofasciculus sp. G3-WIS-01]|uniref:CHASE2 domain-containing protein n=1 Tax=Coleofasciculus sp. G3-WIS-01 TaxID=3069528 RepID=UPI0032F452D2